MYILMYVYIFNTTLQLIGESKRTCAFVITIEIIGKEKTR